MVSLEIKVDRITKVYREGDTIKGNVTIRSKNPFQHQGLSLVADGVASLTVSAKNGGRFESLYNNFKPILLFNYTTELAKPDKLLGDKVIPFSFVLKSKSNVRSLFETYHGVYISVQYCIRCVMKRGLLNKDVSKELEFLVECKSKEQLETKAVPFTITPNSIQNANNKSNLPKFSIRGKLDSSTCCITKPLTGELTVEKSEPHLRSVELQLMRVETVGSAEGSVREVSEIQNLEIGSGDVCHGLSLPIYMIFPRLFACPTLNMTNFKIQYEVNIVFVFSDDRLVVENFPLILTRQ